MTDEEPDEELDDEVRRYLLWPPAFPLQEAGPSLEEVIDDDGSGSEGPQDSL
jgi:hypothetical protein